MTNELSFQFTPTIQDYVRSYQSYQLRRKILLVMFAGLALFEVCLFFALIGGPFSHHLVLWAVLIPIPLFFLFFFAAIPLLFIRQIQKTKERFLSRIIWQLDDRQIQIKNDYSETRVDWGTFQELTETKDYYYLIYTANRTLYQFIPKRALASPNMDAAFREIISRNIGKKHSMD